ncbi:TPA: YebV family protein [Klebsiella pneumoniae]|nr:YebV family protein [Klebsiella pneumoniae]HBV2949419.1 YebV family protein [Klebsiella pneumoniae]
MTTLKNNGLNWSYHNSAEKWGEAMSKTNVRIGAFEIDDAELHGEHQGERTLSIPCKSDPDLCMQLDAWDADTSVPAILNGEHSVLYRKHYDRQSDAWVMRLA